MVEWKLSWLKSFSVSHGPCSRTTTENPLRESSRAMTPPAAPDPMTTKSTSSDGAYVFICGCCCSRRGKISTVIEPEGRRPGIAVLVPDQLPSDFVEVSAVLRVREHPGHGQLA